MANKFFAAIRARFFNTAADTALDVGVSGDANPRLSIDAGGKISWGNGTDAVDTNIYRDSADVLKTDDTFKVPALFIDGIEVDTTGATTNQILKYNGTKFLPAADGGSSGGSYIISATAPVSPSVSDVWFNSDNGRTYIYYNDGNTTQWVEFGNANSGPTGATGATATNINANDLLGTTLASNVVSSSLTSVGTLGSLNVSGVSSFGSEILATTSIGAGRGVGIKADPEDALSILQFTNNAISDQWSSLVATNGLLTATTPFKATQFLQGTDYLSPYQGSRNKIINGTMQVRQRGTSFTFGSGGGNKYYGADRWRTTDYIWSAGSNITVSNETTIVPTGFTNSYKWANGATGLTFSSGGNQSITHAVEGYDASALYGKTCSLSFWVRSSTAGKYSIFFYNNAFTRGLVKTYTINIANTWEYKTMTIDMASAISSGVWEKTTSRGLGVQFMLGTHADRTGNSLLDSWGSIPSYHYATSDSVNLATVANSTFYLTGVQLEQGSVATPFEQRPIQQELTLCERYYETSFRNGQTIGHNSGNFTPYPSDSLGCGGNSYFNHFYRTRKRNTNPTLRIFDPLAAHTVTENWWRYINACNSGNAVGPNVGVNLYADDVCFSGYLQSGATGVAPIFDWTIEAEL
jgi:hypothetical protein